MTDRDLGGKHLMVGMAGMGNPTGAGGSTIVDAFHHAIEHQALVIAAVGFVLFVAWNVLRAQQYRAAIANGTPFPPPREPSAPEPVARRTIRLGFGALWVFDGLLQLQQAMPAGMASSVLHPSAASSPAWVRQVVGFGIDLWSRHPVSAAASAVWIQLGIGIVLLVAPLGRWSRVAGVASVGWGLVVWSFGEAFGGVFAPGLTILFGAPGAAIFYVVAGGVIALPERAWCGSRVSSTLLRASGLFLLAMAVLQAWPGRGFWQGGSTRHPGSLASMVVDMATTTQPHAVSGAISNFATFDEQHGWGVNLFVVVALASCGALLISARRRPAFVGVLTLVVLGLADWFLVEDFGVFGGLGTDPNSMLPMLILLCAGYLGLAGAARSVGEERPVDAVVARPPLRWHTVDSFYAARLAAAIGAGVVVIVGAAPMALASLNSRTDPVLAQAIDGQPTVTNGRAPSFELVDQHGRAVSLSDLRGYTVALTFLDPVCTTDCPIIAQELHRADVLLGAAASKVRFVAIAANPQYHSVAVIDAFDHQEGLSTEANWLFLTGTTSTLNTVLHSYGVSVSLAPAGGMAVHSDVAYVIDRDGIARRIMSTDPGAASASDRSSFATLFATQIEQVMGQ